MGKKMKLPFLFKNSTSDSVRSSSSWPWPSCNQPRTLSFRSPGCGDIFKTINSAYLDADAPESSFFTTSSESASFSTASTEDCAAAGGGGAGPDLTETLIRGLRSERLFFEPGETNSILEEAKLNSGGGGGGESVAFKESLVMSLESREPYADFRRSMEEMVEAHGIKEWDNLEELLCWYLRVNVKQNHEYILGAFVDLLVSLAIKAPDSASSSSSSTSTSSHHHHQQNQDSPSSPLSFYTSSSSSSSSSSTTTACVSSSLEVDDEKEIQEIQEDGDCLDVSCIPVA